MIHKFINSNQFSQDNEGLWFIYHHHHPYTVPLQYTGNEIAIIFFFSFKEKVTQISVVAG